MIGGCPVVVGEKVAANMITWNGPTTLASGEEIDQMLSQRLYQEGGSETKTANKEQDVSAGEEQEKETQGNDVHAAYLNEEKNTGDEDKAAEDKDTEYDAGNIHSKDVGTGIHEEHDEDR
jgi:hypothetical protein